MKEDWLLEHFQALLRFTQAVSRLLHSAVYNQENLQLPVP